MPNYLGIDYGEKRVGLAFGDELGIATPLPCANEPSIQQRLAHIRDLAKKRSIDTVVIGYPLNMDGSAGFKAQEVDAFIEKIEKVVTVPIVKVDERLSSREAENRMKAGGRKAARTTKERQRFRRSGDLDSRAAAVILQDYLNGLYGAEFLEPDLEE